MINLNCISRIESDDIVKIISEKNSGEKKTSLLRNQTKILERYSKFIDIEDNGRLISVIFSNEESLAMHSLYDSKTKTAKSIVEEISKALDPKHSDFCLYCGIGEIDQLDHFLPKEHFPEFSIHHKNLIPICGKCNEIKGSNIPGINNKDYLHLIYDKLPIENYHLCEITYSKKVPRVTFNVSPKFEHTIVGRHYNSLKLGSRIEEKAIQYLLQITALKKQFGSLYADEEVVRDLNKTKAFYGNYYWKSSLLTEMLNTNFIENVE